MKTPQLTLSIWKYLIVAILCCHVSTTRSDAKPLISGLHNEITQGPAFLDNWREKANEHLSVFDPTDDSVDYITACRNFLNSLTFWGYSLSDQLKSGEHLKQPCSKIVGAFTEINNNDIYSDGEPFISWDYLETNTIKTIDQYDFRFFYNIRQLLYEALKEYSPLKKIMALQQTIDRVTDSLEDIDEETSNLLSILTTLKDNEGKKKFAKYIPQLLLALTSKHCEAKYQDAATKYSVTSAEICAALKISDSNKASTLPHFDTALSDLRGIINSPCPQGDLQCATLEAEFSTEMAQFNAFMDCLNLGTTATNCTYSYTDDAGNTVTGDSILVEIETNVPAYTKETGLNHFFETQKSNLATAVAATDDEAEKQRLNNVHQEDMQNVDQVVSEIYNRESNRINHNYLSFFLKKIRLDAVIKMLIRLDNSQFPPATLLTQIKLAYEGRNYCLPNINEKDALNPHDSYFCQYLAEHKTLGFTAELWTLAGDCSNPSHSNETDCQEAGGNWISKQYLHTHPILNIIQANKDQIPPLNDLTACTSECNTTADDMCNNQNHDFVTTSANEFCHDITTVHRCSQPVYTTDSTSNEQSCMGIWDGTSCKRLDHTQASCEAAENNWDDGQACKPKALYSILLTNLHHYAVDHKGTNDTDDDTWRYPIDQSQWQSHRTLSGCSDKIDDNYKACVSLCTYPYLALLDYQNTAIDISLEKKKLMDQVLNRDQTACQGMNKSPYDTTAPYLFLNQDRTIACIELESETIIFKLNHEYDINNNWRPGASYKLVAARTDDADQIKVAYLYHDENTNERQIDEYPFNRADNTVLTTEHTVVYLQAQIGTANHLYNTQFDRQLSWTCTGTECEHWVICGRSGTCSSGEPNRRANDNETHEVRCCSDQSRSNYWRQNNGCSAWAASWGPGMLSCQSNKTFAEAQNICADANARLCTKEELEDNCAAYTGCGDDDLIWACKGTECDPTDPPQCTDGIDNDPENDCNDEDCGVKVYVYKDRANNNLISSLAPFSTFDYETIVPYFEYPQVDSNVVNSTEDDVQGDENTINYCQQPSWGYADNYGVLMVAILTPEATGYYQFFLATDDNSRLWLSTDDTPGNASLILEENNWAYSRDFTERGEASQQLFELQANQPYFIAMAFKEGGGGDNGAVAWRFCNTNDLNTCTDLPNSPIKGKHLTPYADSIANWHLSPASDAAASENSDISQPGDSVTPSSDNSPGGEEAVNAIDNNPYTKYLNFDGSHTSSGLTITTAGGVVVGLGLTSANDVPDRDPASYVLEGSNDGLTFTEIASGDVPSFGARFERQELYFNNATSYTTYRLMFPTTAGPSTCCMQIAEIELLGEFVPEEHTDLVDISQPGNSVTPSSDNSPGDEEAANAIDNQSHTKYLNFDGSHTSSGLTITTAGGVVVGLGLTSANDVPDRDPASYVLEGSNDGLTFTEIASGDVPSFGARFERQELYFNNATSYTTYRLMFPTTAGPSTCCMQIAEIELLSEP